MAVATARRHPRRFPCRGPTITTEEAEAEAEAAGTAVTLAAEARHQGVLPVATITSTIASSISISTLASAGGPHLDPQGTTMLSFKTLPPQQQRVQAQMATLLLLFQSAALLAPVAEG